MRKSFLSAVLVMTLTPCDAAPQSPGTSAPAAGADQPSFEVVSVRENRSGEAGYRTQLRPGGRVTITNAPLRALIVLAYGVLPQQLTGGPDWLDSTRYDIVAQANQNLPMSQPGGPPAPAHLLLQRLLADRFALRVHSDKRELQIYALTVARDDGRLGPAISRSTLDCAARMDAYGRGAGPMPAQSECSMTAAPGRMSARGVVMPMFARGLLSVAVDAIVEDRTGLSGGFDFDLEFSVASATAPVTGGGAEDVSLFTALVEQLGLRLRPLRAPVDVLVIDRVERPAED